MTNTKQAEARDTLYSQPIREIAWSQGVIVDPRWIEGYMRLAHGTLDGLSRQQFRDEVMIAIACIAEEGDDIAERNAQSYGL